MISRISYLISVVIVLVFMPIRMEAYVTDQTDSLKLALLDVKLNEYLTVISNESIDVQCQECDFMIEAAQDSIVREYIADKIYYNYLESPFMGAESVAVHVFDTWYKSGKIVMDQEEFLNASIYAEFNRQSLLGCKAPDLRLQTMEGEWQDVLPHGSGKYAVVYFYDADCAKCKIQSILLRNMLNVEEYPLDFFAVYTGDDYEEWTQYVSDRLAVRSDMVSVHNLWDPEMESDYQKKYGVIVTPRLFLIAPDGVIVGRGLDVKALSQMLVMTFVEKELDYGTKESEELFDMIFASSDMKKSDVVAICDHIAESTLQKGDTLMFRQMAGDLLYYLSGLRSEAAKEGLDYHIDKYILSQEEVWVSSDDSLKVVGMAMLMDDLLSKSTPGSNIPSLTVPGILFSKGKEKKKDVRLDRMRGKKNYIMFYADGCSVCASQKAALRDTLIKDRRSKALLVNMDELLSSQPGLASSLLEKFDLTYLPFIIETDDDGVILRRYISF